MPIPNISYGAVLLSYRCCHGRPVPVLPNSIVRAFLLLFILTSAPFTVLKRPPFFTRRQLRAAAVIVVQRFNIQLFISRDDSVFLSVTAELHR